MEPIDYRNTTFSELSSRVTGLRQRVYRAWQQHGPCTTEELAVRSGISVLSVRPRSTELYQMGFLVLVDGGSRRGGGCYRAAGIQEACEAYHRNRAAAVEPQLQLGI